MARKRRRPIARLLKWATWILSGMAIAQELSKPEDQREWHGEVAGFVPYDFRMPSAERARARWWDPEGALVQPQVFGVGWTINLGALINLIKTRLLRPPAAGR